MVTSRFNSTDLSKLLKKPNASVYLRKCKRHIALSPKALNNINDSVLAHLNRLIRKFDSELDAVVLGCRNVNILTNLGTIMDDSPHVHIDIEAEFYLFKPEKGSILSGIVNKKSRDNIGCLVHDIFNASIPIEPDDEVDIDNVSLGQALTFRVEVVDFSHSLPYIKGKLFDSRELSPGKQTSGNKKRKRSDELEACKRIKSEVDDFLFENDDGNTSTPSIKFPTSILKRATPFGVESSPARRISFYGDTPYAEDDPPIETSTDKAKKKKKKENKASVEENPSGLKKKKMVNSFGNEPETGIFIQDSMKIDKPSTGKQKVKKKKSEQTETVSEITDEPEQDLNILHNFKDHSKKKKNKIVVESNSFKLMEADEVSKERNKPPTAQLKAKKKKKGHEEISEELSGSYHASHVHEKNKIQGSRDENETQTIEENYEEQEEVKESPSQKKFKKNKKMTLSEQENTHYATGQGGQYEEKTWDSPHKRKKKISDGQGQMKRAEKEVLHDVSEITNQTLEDTKEMKTKKKGTRVDVQQNVSSLSPEANQEPIFTNEIDIKKKMSRKGKKVPLLTHTSSSCGEQYLEGNVQAVQLTPVVKKKKNKKISQEDVQVSDSGEQECFGKIDKSMPKIQSIANTKLSKEKKGHGDNDSSFESLSPIEKSDDDDDDDDETSGFITSTQIETHSAKKFSNSRGEVSMRNSCSDSDSFDVEEFSYVPQGTAIVREKEGSKERTSSDINSRNRKTRSSSATNVTKTPTKPVEHSNSDDSSNNLDIPRSSPFTSKQKMSDLKTVQSKSQKSHFKPGKSNSSSSSSSDSEAHSLEQRNTLQEARNESTEVYSPKSKISKVIEIDKGDKEMSTAFVAVTEKHLHSNDKKMKFPLSRTKQTGNESSDADSTDSDLPSFMQKPTRLPSVDIKKGNLPYEPSVSNSSVDKKEMKKLLKIADGEMLRPEAQKLNTKSSDKKKSFSTTNKTPGIRSNTFNLDVPLSLEAKMRPQKQSSLDKKCDSHISSDLDLPLTAGAKTIMHKQSPASHKKHDSDSISSDSDLPEPLGNKTTRTKQLPTSRKKPVSDKNSSDSNLPSTKVAKTTALKQLPALHKRHDSDSSSSDSDSPEPMRAKTTPKQFPTSHKSSSDSNLPLSIDLPSAKVVKTKVQKQFPALHKKHDSDSSSFESDIPESAAKMSTPRQSSASNKKSVSHGETAVSDSSSQLKTKKSAGKKSTGREIPSNAENKISSPKKAGTNEPKRTKHQSKLNGKKKSGSGTDPLVESLLAKVRTEILDSLDMLPPLKNVSVGKVVGKMTSEDESDANSLLQTEERKGKRTTKSKETVDSSVGSKKSRVNSRKKHKPKEMPKGLTNFSDQLLKYL